MVTSFKRCIVFFVLAVFMLINGGCVSPYVMEAAGGAAGGAAPSSSDYLGRGKGESYFIARYDDGKANKIKLFIERRTDTLTSIVFDVGWFGSIAFGRLTARQIIAELDQAGAFLEDWMGQGFDY